MNVGNELLTRLMRFQLFEEDKQSEEGREQFMMTLRNNSGGPGGPPPVGSGPGPATPPGGQM